MTRRTPSLFAAITVVASLLGAAGCSSSAPLPVVQAPENACESDPVRPCIRSCEAARNRAREKWRIAVKGIDERAEQDEARLESGERLVAAFKRAQAIAKKRPLDRAALQTAAAALKDAEVHAHATDPSYFRDSTTADELSGALATGDVEGLRFAFENNACIGLAIHRGGASKLAPLEHDVDALRAAIKQIRLERAAVHAALDAVEGGDRSAMEAASFAEPIAPCNKGRAHDYKEQQRATDDVIDLC